MKIIKHSLLGVLSLLILSAPANAARGVHEFETNELFYARCNGKLEAGKESYCNGPFEVFLQLASTNGQAGMFCPPSQNVSMQEYANIYFRWVENNPEFADEDFFQGMNRALGNAFPCQDEYY